MKKESITFINFEYSVRSCDCGISIFFAENRNVIGISKITIDTYRCVLEECVQVRSQARDKNGKSVNFCSCAIKIYR